MWKVVAGWGRGPMSTLLGPEGTAVGRPPGREAGGWWWLLLLMRAVG